MCSVWPSRCWPRWRYFRPVLRARPPAGRAVPRRVERSRSTPGLTKTAKVQTITFNLPLKSCKGGGVTGASIKGSEKTKPVSIKTFSTGKPLPLSATINWAPKAKGTSKFDRDGQDDDQEGRHLVLDLLEDQQRPLQRADADDERYRRPRQARRRRRDQQLESEGRQAVRDQVTSSNWVTAKSPEVHHRPRDVSRSGAEAKLGTPSPSG